VASKGKLAQRRVPKLKHEEIVGPNVRVYGYHNNICVDMSHGLFFLERFCFFGWMSEGHLFLGGFGFWLNEERPFVLGGFGFWLNEERPFVLGGFSFWLDEKRPFVWRDFVLIGWMTKGNLSWGIWFLVG
jgi:hypothetical protein